LAQEIESYGCDVTLGWWPHDKWYHHLAARLFPNGFVCHVTLFDAPTPQCVQNINSSTRLRDIGAVSIRNSVISESAWNLISEIECRHMNFYACTFEVDVLEVLERTRAVTVHVERNDTVFLAATPSGWIEESTDAMLHLTRMR
jgi:hypothetical protein